MTYFHRTVLLLLTILSLGCQHQLVTETYEFSALDDAPGDVLDDSPDGALEVHFKVQAQMSARKLSREVSALAEQTGGFLNDLGREDGFYQKLNDGQPLVATEARSAELDLLDHQMALSEKVGFKIKGGELRYQMVHGHLSDLWTRCYKNKELPTRERLQSALSRTGNDMMMLSKKSNGLDGVNGVNGMNGMEGMQVQLRQGAKLQMDEVVMAYALDQFVKSLKEMASYCQLEATYRNGRWGCSWKVDWETQVGTSELLTNQSVVMSIDPPDERAPWPRYTRRVHPSTGIGIQGVKTITLKGADLLTMTAVGLSLSALQTDEDNWRRGIKMASGLKCDVKAEVEEQVGTTVIVKVFESGAYQ